MHLEDDDMSDIALELTDNIALSNAFVLLQVIVYHKHDLVSRTVASSMHLANHQLIRLTDAMTAFLGSALL